MLSLHFQVFHMFVYMVTCQNIVSQLTLFGNIALILTHVVFALSDFHIHVHLDK